MLSFVVNGEACFTGDTLFAGSVGGTTDAFDDLRRSIMDVLMELPKDTRLHPGHTDPTTVGEEWEQNAFVRLWRGLDEEGSEPCTVEGEEATLVLWAPDYDGGHKAWVRWPDGRDDIVPGSRVSR
jgi:hydroxyacylglutathione hydrolase